MTEFPVVGYLLVFTAIGAGFIIIHMIAGKLFRPVRPNPEKATIYECGEPTIGSAWVQFDLRYYVVALLFVIFDVEVTFFFPWAVVFGQANTAANENVPIEKRAEAVLALVPDRPEYLLNPVRYRPDSREHQAQTQRNRIRALLQEGTPEAKQKLEQELAGVAGPARRWGWLAFFDILVFFGVLLVGFAYLWKRGDLAWVRALAASGARPPATAPPMTLPMRGEQETAGSAS